MADFKAMGGRACSDSKTLWKPFYDYQFAPSVRRGEVELMPSAMDYARARVLWGNPHSLGGYRAPILVVGYRAWHKPDGDPVRPCRHYRVTRS
jgi:hypothetical protein